VRADPTLAIFPAESGSGGALFAATRNRLGADCDCLTSNAKVKPQFCDSTHVKGQLTPDIGHRFYGHPTLSTWSVSEYKKSGKRLDMGSATTSQQFIRQIGAALGVSTFVLAATVGGFRLGLLLMIAVSAGTFACVLALPAHSLHDAHQIDAVE
jgi:hypothetical protein